VDGRVEEMVMWEVCGSQIGVGWGTGTVVVGVHHQTVRRKIHSGDLAAYRIGSGMSELRIRRGDLERWLYGEEPA
jgi:excisionase family DNA binding protein